MEKSDDETMGDDDDSNMDKEEGNTVQTIVTSKAPWILCSSLMYLVNSNLVLSRLSTALLHYNAHYNT